MGKLESDGNNIMVCVRVRPFNKREVEGQFKLCIRMPTTRHVQISDENEQMKEFEFDRAYWSHSQSIPESGFCDQVTLYDELGEMLIDNAINGYNNCMFAYGQTGSGKSHSVLGDLKHPEFKGLLPRVVEGLFLKFEDMRQTGALVVCHVSFLEIYNEALKDLLASEEELKTQGPLDVKQSGGTGVHIPGLTQVEVITEKKVLEIIDTGVSRREVASTAMNATSSRSHCIFTFYLDVEINSNITGKKKFKSQTHLVDLAGSERADRTKATGDRLKEGAAINKSLSILARVISALASMGGVGKKKENPPFRESKLTYLLKDSLSGNSKTVMMTALSPSVDSYEETLSTLQFAKSVKAIKTTAKQDISGGGDAGQLQANLLRLQAILEELNVDPEKSDMGNIQILDENKEISVPGVVGGGGGGGGGGKKVKELEEKLQKAEERLKQFGTNLDDTHDGKGEQELKISTKRISISAKKLVFRRQDNKEFQPYFTNVSTDPLKSGSLIHFIERDTPSNFGSHEAADVKLSGKYMWPFMAQCTNHYDTEVSIKLEMPEAWPEKDANDKAEEAGNLQRRIVTVIRGLSGKKEELNLGDKIVLHNEDIVQIGAAGEKFRLILPLAMKRSDWARKMKLKKPLDDDGRVQSDDELKEGQALSDLDTDEEEEVDETADRDFVEGKIFGVTGYMEDEGGNIVGNITQLVSQNVTPDSPEHNACKEFIATLGRGVDRRTMGIFWMQLQQLFPLIKEANLITNDVKATSGLRFSLGFSLDMYRFKLDVPRLVIHLWRDKLTGVARWRYVVYNKVIPKHIFHVVKDMYGCQDFYTKEPVATFDLWEFRRRLHIMRKVHQLAMDEGLRLCWKYLKINPLLNDPWFYSDIDTQRELALGIGKLVATFDGQKKASIMQIEDLMEKQEQYDIDMKENEKKTALMEKNMEVHMRDLGRKDAELEDKMKTVQESKIKSEQDLLDLSEEWEEKYRMQQEELDKEISARFELNNELRAEREKLHESLKNGKMMTREDHETKTKIAVQEALERELTNFVSLDDHEKKLSFAASRERELQNRVSWLREKMNSDYILRSDHDTTVGSLQRQIKDWTQRALDAVNSQVATEARYRNALVVGNSKEGQSYDISEAEQQSILEQKKGVEERRLRLKLDGLDDETLDIFRGLTQYINEANESVDMVHGKLGRLNNVYDP